MSQSIAEGGVQYGFVGAGVMAEVMVSGLLQEGGLRPDQLIVSDRSSARQAALGALGVRVTPDNLTCALASPVVVLAVKPQTLAEVLAELRGRLPADTLVVSIVAGARIRAIQEGLGHARVVRCMPNLPCRIRQGMTVWTAASGASGLDAARTRALLRPMGIEHYVDDEGHLDRATAVSGSGPAIVAEFIKAMFEAAVFIGEPRGLAHESVLATVIGTAQMIREEGQRHTHVAQLIDEVTSPGGTTSRALQVLKRGQLAATINDAVEAAHARTVALGDALEQSLLTAAAQAPGLPAPTAPISAPIPAPAPAPAPVAPLVPPVTVAPAVPVVTEAPEAPEVAVQHVVPVAPVVLVAPAPFVAAPKAPAVTKAAKAKAAPKAEPKDPVAPAEAAAPEAPPETVEARVLVVDDHAVNRQALTLVLAPLGITPVTIGSAEEGLELLARETFDVVLMDVYMPDMDGRDATRLLRSRPGPNQSTPVIAITASATERDWEACRAAGMTGHVAKPIEPAQLYAALEAALSAVAEREVVAA